MDGLRKTTARLRRTLAYPTDDSNGQPEIMDEEEQERLIERLVHENVAGNQQFRWILLALPLLASLPFLPGLLYAGTLLRSMLSLTSLLSTAFIVHHFPPATTGLAPLDRWIRPIRSPSRSTTISRKGVSTASEAAHHSSPLASYLPYLNIALCAMLVIMGAFVGRDSVIGFSVLPAVMYATVVACKVAMGSVDPERELSAYKYHVKGA